MRTSTSLGMTLRQLAATPHSRPLHMSPPPSFQIVPDQADIDTMLRDLRFHPCTNDNPHTLTRAQIDQFNRDGFLKGIRIFNEQDAESHHRYFDALLAKVLGAGNDSYSISSAHLKY